MGKYQRLLFVLIIVVNLIYTVHSAHSDSRNTPSASPLGNPVVKIGRVICGGHLSLAVAEKKYQQSLSSFQLKTVQYHRWKDVINDMLSGKVAGSFMLSPLAMELIRLGFPAKIVMKADRNGNGFVLSDKIKSISDLNTRKTIIAVPHIYSQHHVLLHQLLEQNNILPENITVIGMPPRDMINSLRREEIDGFVVGEPEGNKAVSLDVGWLAAISPQIWKDHMDHVFIATDQFINKQSAQLQELINVLVRGGQFIEANPHEAAIMGESYTGSTADVFEQVLTSPPEWIDYSDMLPTINDIIAMSSNMVRMNLWNDIPSDPSVFIDPGFAQKAIKNLSNLK